MKLNYKDQNKKIKITVQYSEKSKVLFLIHWIMQLRIRIKVFGGQIKLVLTKHIKLMKVTLDILILLL